MRCIEVSELVVRLLAFAVISFSGGLGAALALNKR